MSSTHHRIRPRDVGLARHLVLITAAVAIVAAVAIAVTALSPEAESTGTELEQYRDVTVVGDVLAPYPGKGERDPALGRQAPEVTGAAFDGTPVRIGPGQPTLVVFVAHWCPHCQAEVPRIVDWIESGEVPAGLRIVGVSTAATSARPNFPPSAWLERERFTPEVLVDDVLATAAQAFGLQGFPMLVMLDGDSTVVWRVDGELAEGQLAAMVDSALTA